MKEGDYVQLVHRIPRWPRKSRGTIIRNRGNGFYDVQAEYGNDPYRGRVFSAKESELIRLLRKEDTLA